MDPLSQFVIKCKEIRNPAVLELGTRRSIPDRSTKHNEWVQHASEFIGTDIQPGLDVDVVADGHKLSEVFGCNKFDAVISCSTFEHFKYPHLAAHELMKILKVGGILFIQTHQTFPLHAYPYDYFRFSREALAGLFGTKMGFHVISTDYEFPARIYSEREPNIKDLESFLNVRLYGEKISVTPGNYIYEYD
ncbi:MAG: hypothetical protein FD174_2519 [Geobacteraceae bacterium]|nr:MAG: hypothetical protein FD174_2519 [Geobacteraceae bacterium]